MVRYLGVRLLQAVGVLWAAYTVAFLVLYALPGDPVSLLAGADANDISPAQLDALRTQYGLDRPLLVQYLDQLAAALHGDLGRSRPYCVRSASSCAGLMSFASAPASSDTGSPGSA